MPVGIAFKTLRTGERFACPEVGGRGPGNKRLCVCLIQCDSSDHDESTDVMRVLYARAGTPHCTEHDLPLQSQTVSQMVDAVLALPLDTRLVILAPVAREKKGEFLELFAEMQAQGFVRFRINAKAYEFDDVLLTHQFNPAVFGLALIRLVGSNGRCGTGAKGSEPGCSNPVFACQGIHH